MARAPKLFFKTETKSYGEGESRQSYTVSQLMPAGAMLVAIDDGGQGAADKAVDNTDKQANYQLVAGSFVEFSSDKRALLATVDGYPNLTRKKQGREEQLIVSLEPLILLAEDGWTAKMTLYPAIAGTALPDGTDIIDKLHQADVRWGIREKNISACIKKVKNDNIPVKEQVIVRGRLPVNGEDARLRLDVAVGEQAGKELGDGRMDFHERRLFVGVDKGQLLATKVQATSGIPGLNIFGQEVPQVSGNDLTIKIGEDLTYDEQKGEIFAAIAGVLSVVADTTVRVTAKQAIPGDVDFHTGNIDSRNAVDISGSVNPGFTVRTGADLLIGGNVDSAHVISQGNVIVRGAMTGKEATIEAEGDVDIPVIRNGSINSRGSVNITKEAYYTEVRCLKDIICSGQAKVVGSDLLAGGSITAMGVDTQTSPNSFLAAAVVPERYLRYQRLLKNFYQAKAAIEAWYRRFGTVATNEDLQELQEELAGTKAALAGFNLSPGAGEKEKSTALRYACRQKVTINGLILAGAVIRIGNSETTLQKSYSDGYFTLNSDSGEIEFHAK